MRPKHIVLSLILLVIIVGGFYGYQLYQKKTPDIVNRTPDVVIGADDLLNAFNSDTASARKQYVDKIIEVTGMVKRIDTAGAVVLGDSANASEITVGFDRRHMKDYRNLKVGINTVVQGVCSGYNKASGDDLLASLGTTVELRSAGVKEKK